METPEITEALDQMEQKLIDKLAYHVRSGHGNEMVKYSQTLVNIAMYRRLKTGLKVRVRSDGSVDIAGINQS